jgi:hypothetical protein
MDMDGTEEKIIYKDSSNDVGLVVSNLQCELACTYVWGPYILVSFDLTVVQNAFSQTFKIFTELSNLKGFFEGTKSVLYDGTQEDEDDKSFYGESVDEIAKNGRKINFIIETTPESKVSVVNNKYLHIKLDTHFQDTTIMTDLNIKLNKELFETFLINLKANCGVLCEKLFERIENIEKENFNYFTGDNDVQTIKNKLLEEIRKF